MGVLVGAYSRVVKGRRARDKQRHNLRHSSVVLGRPPRPPGWPETSRGVVQAEAPTTKKTCLGRSESRRPRQKQPWRGVELRHEADATASQVLAARLAAKRSLLSAQPGFPGVAAGFRPPSHAMQHQGWSRFWPQHIRAPSAMQVTTKGSLVCPSTRWLMWGTDDVKSLRYQGGNVGCCGLPRLAEA